MKPLKKYITFLIFIIITGLAGGLFVYLQESHPEQGDSIIIPNLESPVEVLLDQNENNHIYAQNSADLYKTLGYLHAAQHLVKMDLFQRTANGTLSSVFGTDYLDIDIFSRTIGFASTASEFIPMIDPAVTAILSAYCDGINVYIDQNKFQLPPEFKIRQYTPSYWKPADCLAIQRLLAWSLSDQLIKKIAFYKLLEIYGIEKVREGFPVINNFPPDLFPLYNTELFSELNTLISGHIHMLDILNITAEDLENSYVLSSKFTANQVPVIGAELPGFMNDFSDIIELHAPGMNLFGLTIPGITFIFTGSNSIIAWNLTIRPTNNLEFMQSTCTENTDQYIFNNQRCDFNYRNELISIRNQPDTIISIPETNYGPVIAKTDRSVISVYWKGAQFSDDLKSFLNLYSATEWEGFKNAISLHIMPPAEVDYLDINANIGTAQFISDLKFNPHPAHLPTLSRFHEPDFTVPINHLFRNFNPQIGYVRHYRDFTKLNADSVSNTPIFPDKTYTIRELADMHLDIQNRILLSRFFEIISLEDLNQPLHKQAYSLLSEWNDQLPDSNPALTIISSFLSKLYELTYRDEFDLADRQLYDQFSRLTDELFLNLLYLLQDSESSWFDNIRTTEIVEYRKAIVLDAFCQTIDDLSALYSTNINQWVPENILNPAQINRTNLTLVMDPDPAIYRTSVLVRSNRPGSRERRIIHSTVRITSGNRTEMLQDGARIISVTSE